ncbi:hypothetical protein [Methylobacter sp.]|uniref:hypothetical protein n=1 Tax=Methylobacter sp. TaxID=2051955 RepID=UPI002FDCEACE
MNHAKYIALLEKDNARLEDAIAARAENHKLLDERVRESLRRASKYLDQSCESDNAQYFADTLELLDLISHQGGPA